MAVRTPCAKLEFTDKMVWFWGRTFEFGKATKPVGDVINKFLPVIVVRVDKIVVDVDNGVAKQGNMVKDEVRSCVVVDFSFVVVKLCQSGSLRSGVSRRSLYSEGNLRFPLLRSLLPVVSDHIRSMCEIFFQFPGKIFVTCPF